MERAQAREAARSHRLQPGMHRAAAASQRDVTALFSELADPNSPASLLRLQRTAGNAAVAALLRREAGADSSYGRPVHSPATSLQRVDQSLPYVGPVLSYLNPLNQLARGVLPGLDARQKSLLDRIFGAALSTSIIRLNANSLLGAGNCYRTTGNIINMPGTTIDDYHLVHEAAHVWQSQNGIPFGYAISALSAMAQAEIFTGDWQNAYDYSLVERYHVPWNWWNAEQQAHWIADHSKLPGGWAWVSLPDWLLPGGVFHPDIP